LQLCVPGKREKMKRGNCFEKILERVTIHFKTTYKGERKTHPPFLRGGRRRKLRFFIHRWKKKKKEKTKGGGGKREDGTDRSFPFLLGKKGSGIFGIWITWGRGRGGGGGEPSTVVTPC